MSSEEVIQRLIVDYLIYKACPHTYKTFTMNFEKHIYDELFVRREILNRIFNKEFRLAYEMLMFTDYYVNIPGIVELGNDLVVLDYVMLVANNQIEEAIALATSIFQHIINSDPTVKKFKKGSSDYHQHVDKIIQNFCNEHQISEYVYFEAFSVIAMKDRIERIEELTSEYIIYLTQRKFNDLVYKYIYKREKTLFYLFFKHIKTLKYCVIKL